jgi:hypothetical protein
MSSHTAATIWSTVAVAAVVAYIWALSHAERLGTPARIIRRLQRTGQPVTVTARGIAPHAWNPTTSNGYGAFYASGTATYNLEGLTTIRVHFVPKSGPVFERSCAIPSHLLPDPPAMRRRRWIARAVIACYFLAGAAAFAATASTVRGSPALRIRAASLVSLAVIAIAWLTVHTILKRNRTPAGQPRVMHARRVCMWLVGYLVTSSVLAVAWQIGSRDEVHPASWANSFISGGFAVLAVGAALAASFHHHTYIHHSD